MQQEFIQGVKLLCTQITYIPTKGVVFSGIALLLAINLLVLTFTDYKSGAYGRVCKTEVVIVAAFVFMALTGKIPKQCQQVLSVRYKVLVDDAVSFKDFDRKYEVVDQEGEIYTIKIKEEE